MNLSNFFHKNTKNLLSQKISDPKNWPLEWKKIYFKAYPRLEEFLLPDPNKPMISLADSIKNRKSSRVFSDTPLSISELSVLLHYSCGILNETNSWDESRRPYPSGGARYPLEIYLGTNSVKGLEKGVFHYNVKGHFLEKIGGEKILKDLKSSINPSWTKKSALILIITAVFHRSLQKYQDRGYRYILLEAGHMAQNLYLLSTALNLKCCGLGDFYEEKVDSILDLDNKIEGTLYILVFGK